jgi:hypothetical protein
LPALNLLPRERSNNYWMRTLVATCVLAITLLLGPPFQTPTAGQQPEEVKANAVVAEARKALGGEDKLAAVKRLQINGTTRRANGNFNLEGDTEIFLELPDKFRRNEALTLGGGGTGIDRTEILNGTEFFTEVSGGDFGGRGRGRFGGGFPGAGGAAAGGADGRGAPSPEAQERLRDFQRRNLQSEVSRLLIAFLLTSDAPFRWIGTAQAPEGSADVLEVKTADGVATRVFIDTMTHMPLMLTWTGPAGRGFGGRGQGRRGQAADPAGAPTEGRASGDQPAAPAGGADPTQGRRGRGAQGPPATLEMHLAEYKTVNGVKLPHLITRGASGETSEEWVIKGYKINPNLKANTFTK